MLLHAGTNDLNSDQPADPYASAPERLGNLIDQVLCTCPEATIIVAQIIESSNSGTSERIAAFNAEVPDVVNTRAARGSKVMAVDMSSIGVNGYELTDDLHPNDQGYVDMATFWFSALQEASGKGWITAPKTPQTPDSATSAGQCAGGSWWYPARQTA